MTSALNRGRTLARRAVAAAKKWREQRIKYLLSQDRLSLTFKERSEARRLTGRWDFWELPKSELERAKEKEKRNNEKEKVKNSNPFNAVGLG